MDHGHRFALYSVTGVHIGLWSDLQVVLNAQREYPDSYIEEMVLIGNLENERKLSKKLARTLERTARSTDSDSVFYARQEALEAYRDAHNPTDGG